MARHPCLQQHCPYNADGRLFYGFYVYGYVPMSFIRLHLRTCHRLIRPGTSVGVYGTMASADAAYVTYCIDDSPPIAMSTSQEPHRRLLFQSETLPDEDHRLVVIQTGNNSLFSLDYLMYQPSAFSPVSRLPPAALVTRQDTSNPLTLLTPGVAVVDDFNQSSVLFQGSWTTGGQSVEYNRTTHGTYAPGSIATLNFTGTRSHLEPTNRDP